VLWFVGFGWPSGYKTPIIKSGRASKDALPK